MADQTFNLGHAGRATEAQPSKAAYQMSEAGSLTGAVGGIGAAVLAILGLIGLAPRIMDSVAAIAAGTALLAEGGTIAAGFRRRMGTSESGHAEKEIAGGLGIQALAGIAGIALGILALLNFNPELLLCSAAIAMGAGLLLSGGAVARLEKSLSHHLGDTGEKAAHTAVYASGGTETLVGIGAATLGILGLVLGNPIFFTLISMLAIGAAVFFSGTSIASRLYSFFE